MLKVIFNLKLISSSNVTKYCKLPSVQEVVILYSALLYDMGQYFLDIHYVANILINTHTTSAAHTEVTHN